eukprot:m.42105 g.42105  ORF g.42105 m.42105 type:complete len:162 (+) comp19004_c0_seq2:310-795(+)
MMMRMSTCIPVKSQMQVGLFVWKSVKSKLTPVLKKCLSSTSVMFREGKTKPTSKTGVAYDGGTDVPKIHLFTKEGCSLCDDVEDILVKQRSKYPHSLYRVDITDEGNEVVYKAYQYHIPVLHVNNLYWTKHRVTSDEAITTLQQAWAGTFVAQLGDPMDER